MSLRKRQRNGIWYLRGTVRGQTVYESTGTSDAEAAEAIRIRKENDLLNASIFGKETVYAFTDAVVSYLEHKPRSTKTKAVVQRLLGYWVDTKLKDIDQLAVDAMCRTLVPSGSVHGKLGLIVMLNAVLDHAARRKMCPRPMLDKPRTPTAATPFLFPEQATALARAAALHLRPLIVPRERRVPPRRGAIT